MRYSVLSTPLADHQLSEIWLEAANRREVTEASDRIEMMLRNDAHELGELRKDNRRAIVLPPLTVTFEVSVDDRKATIVSIRYSP